MNWIPFILVSNIGIAILEYVYRKAVFASFWASLPYTIIPILIGQFGLFYAFRVGGASSLIMAGMVFTLMNVALRIVNTLLLGEPIGWTQIVALSLFIGASVVLQIK